MGPSGSLWVVELGVIIRTKKAVAAARAKTKGLVIMGAHMTSSGDGITCLPVSCPDTHGTGRSPCSPVALAALLRIRSVWCCRRTQETKNNGTGLEREGREFWDCRGICCSVQSSKHQRKNPFWWDLELHVVCVSTVRLIKNAYFKSRENLSSLQNYCMKATGASYKSPKVSRKENNNTL